MKQRSNKQRRFFIVITLCTGLLITSCEGASSTESDSDILSKDQGHFWTSNIYMVTESGSLANSQNMTFGVNEATGHIKAYISDVDDTMAKHVRAVDGSTYGTTYTYEDVTDSSSDLQNTNTTCTINDSLIDNGDGTITDTDTGLMWMADDAGSAMEWKEALAYCENLTYAQYTDWRLPNVKQLQTIVDYSGSYPAINQNYFTTTSLTDDNPNYYYWTSTSAYFNTESPTYEYAWYVAFGFAVGDDDSDSHGAGAVRFSPKSEDSTAECEGGDNMTNSVHAVRLDSRYTNTVVKTGQTNCYNGEGTIINPGEGDDYYGQDGTYQSGVDFDFTLSSDGTTVTDNNTGLTWEVTPSDDHMSLTTAETYCDDLELGSYDDFRIPTAEELYSIQDFSTGWPYVDEDYFNFPASDGISSGPQG